MLYFNNVLKQRNHSPQSQNVQMRAKITQKIDKKAQHTIGIRAFFRDFLRNIGRRWTFPSTC